MYEAFEQFSESRLAVAMGMLVLGVLSRSSSCIVLKKPIQTPSHADHEAERTITAFVKMRQVSSKSDINDLQQHTTHPLPVVVVQDMLLLL